MDISVPKGDLKNKLKKGKLCMNNTKAIGNSINHHDNRMEHEYMNHHEEDTIRLALNSHVFKNCDQFFFFFFHKIKYLGSSIVLFLNSHKSYGSHNNRPFKDESHKGSADSLDGEEKKDASKEDLDQEGSLLGIDRSTIH